MGRRMKMYTILITEDERFIRSNIKNTLEQDYLVKEAGDVKEALKIFQMEAIDLCLIDVNLPDYDGFYLCRKIREKSQIPIIFLTVKDDEESILKGLSLGADDYITKPFSLRILKMRIWAQLRRNAPPVNDQSHIIQCGEYSLNLKTYTLSQKGTNIKITKTEYEILKHPTVNRKKSFFNTMVQKQIPMLLPKIWPMNYPQKMDLPLTLWSFLKILFYGITIYPMKLTRNPFYLAKV